MKNKPTALIIALVILIVYIASVVVVDPYNYFNTGIVSETAKKHISMPLNERLYRINGFKHNKTENILIGDSRIGNLDVEKVEEATGDTYYNFGYGACSVPELVSTFWYVADMVELKNVYLGISFSIYNKYSNKNIFTDAEKSSSLFFAIFNSATIKSIFYLAKNAFSKEEINLNKPNMEREEFWTQLIEDETRKFYELYLYPEEYNKDLLKIKEYCNENNINLVFIIPPNHIEAQKKVSEYKLDEEYARFKKDIKSISRTIDFDYDSELTRNKENYGDPFHVTDDKEARLIDIIFNDSANFELITTPIDTLIQE